MTSEIRGSPVFQREELSPTSGYRRVEGTEKTPFKAGLFQNVTDVSWPTGTFLYAGFILTLNSFFDKDGFNFPWEDWHSSSFVSKDGQDWSGNPSFNWGGLAAGAGTSGGTGINVGLCVRDPELGDVFVIGGLTVEARAHQEFTPIGNTFSHGVPTTAFSRDGISWHSQPLPEFDPNTDGTIIALGFLPEKKKFFAMGFGVVQLGPGSFASKTVYYETSKFGDFGETSTELGSLGHPPSSAKFPEGTLTVDASGKSAPGVKYIASSGRGQKVHFRDGTVAADEDGVYVKFRDQDETTVSPPSDGVIKWATINKAGSALVVVVETDIDSEIDEPIPSPAIFMSPDLGISWQRVCNEATQPALAGRGSVCFG